MPLVFLYCYIWTEDIGENKIRTWFPDNLEILEFCYNYLISKESSKKRRKAKEIRIISASNLSKGSIWQRNCPSSSIKSRSTSWQYRSNPLGCQISSDSGSSRILFRSHDCTVPRTGSLICSAKIVGTSRSIVLATSSSFAIEVFVSKCGPQ